MLFVTWRERGVVPAAIKTMSVILVAGSAECICNKQSNRFSINRCKVHSILQLRYC